MIGNKTFIEFVEQLEREEDIQLDTFKVGEKVSIVTIAPDPKKTDKDIAIPVLSPILTRKKSLAEEIAELDVSAFNCPVLPRKQDDAAAKTFRYEGYDIITLQKLIEREYTIPEPQTAEEVIGYYARRIAQDVKLPSQFAALAPKVQGVSRDQGVRRAGDVGRARDDQGDQQQRRPIRDGENIRRGAAEARHCRTGAAASARRPAAVRNTAISLVARDACGRQVRSSTSCRATTSSKRSSPSSCRRPTDVQRFAKLPEQFGFAIEYTDNAGNLRYYEPDFVVLTNDGTPLHCRDEGLGGRNVANKDRAAQLWCENTTRLTGKAGRT